MKIIYVSQKKSYAAIIAAYVRLKVKIEKDSNLKKKFYKNQGKFIYLGRDETFNEIYFLYSSKPLYILKNILEGFSNIYNEEIEIVYI